MESGDQMINVMWSNKNIDTPLRYVPVAKMTETDVWTY